MSPVLPLYFASLGFSAVEIGILFSMWGVGTILFEPTVGILADRGGRRAMMFAICLGTCALYLLYTFTGSFVDFAVLQFFLGGMFAGIAVLFRYTIPSVVAPGRPSSGFGLLGFAWSGAAVMGALIGGFVLSATGYALPFYLASGVAALAIAPLWLSRIGGQTARRTTDTRERPAPSGSRTTELVLMGGMAMSAFLIFVVIFSMLPLVVSAAPFDASPFEVGVLLALFNCSLLLFQPVIGHYGASRPRAWMAFGLLAGVLCFIVLVFAKSTPAAYASAVIAGISFSAISTHSLARFTKLISASRQGVAIGIYGAAEDVGVIVGPLVFSAIWSAVSLDAALVATSAILLVVLLGYVFPKPSPPKGSGIAATDAKSPLRASLEP
jgi:MFS family permease